MKNRAVIIVCLVGCFLGAYSQQQLNADSILAKMKLANSYFLKKWPDPTANIVTNKSRPSNLWTRGTYYEGLMQLYFLTKDPLLLAYATDWGTYHKWQPTYVGATVTRIADNQCCGQTYLELFQLDPTKTERISTIQASIDAMVNSAKVNDWWWIDALHMAMPVFAKLGVITKDKRYFGKMYELYRYTKSQAKGIGLYNSADSLWYRDSVYLPPKTSANGLPVYWSRGNGWVFAALTRTLDVLPDTAAYRDEYLRTFREMAAKLIRLQRPDGFWNCNLGDPNDYGGKESSGTVFFAYGLAWGINHHVLDSAIFYKHALSAWNGLCTYALHPDGAIGYMQSSGSKPADGQPLSYDKMPDFEDFGLGGFLLAGSELYKLALNAKNTETLIFNTSRNDTYPLVSICPTNRSLRIMVGSSTSSSIVEIYSLSGKKLARYDFRNMHKAWIWNYGPCEKVCFVRSVIDNQVAVTKVSLP